MAVVKILAKRKSTTFREKNTLLNLDILCILGGESGGGYASVQY